MDRRPRILVVETSLQTMVETSLQTMVETPSQMVEINILKSFTLDKSKITNNIAKSISESIKK
jgi:hypothetical protein